MKKLKMLGFGIKDIIYVAGLLIGGFFGYTQTISTIKITQAITDEKVANLQTDFNIHSIDQKEIVRELTSEVKKLTEEIYELKVQIDQ